jgi:LacI family transcriptional regulator, gluconate utilization system Gnt-I transcriptional repressor
VTVVRPEPEDPEDKAMNKKRSNGRPTIADVAALAGVGAITVSRALREPERVSAALRAVIDKAVQELNYVPDLNARALASRRTDAVAVLVPSLTQNIFSDVVRGIYDGLEDSSLRIELANTRYNADLEEELIFRIIRHQPAAIIVSGVEQKPRTRLMLEEAGCPIVQIMDLTDDPIQKIIGFSHHRAGLEMTQHLIAAGYRRIAFFSGWMNARSQQRRNGYRQALEEAGLFDPALIGEMGNDDPESSRGARQDYHQFSTAVMGRQMMLDMLDRHPDLDAVFCNNDVLSIGALFACNARGVEVPKQVGIAGFNDFDYMAAAHPPLTSIRIHRWKCGFEAMKSVRAQLKGEPMGERVVDLGFDIMKRASTDRRGELGAGPASDAEIPFILG